MKTKLIVVAVALACLGCVSVGRKLDPTKISQIKKGETTRADVVKLVGSPDQVINVDGQVTYSYMHIYSQANGATFIPIVGAFAGGATAQHQFLQVKFDSDDKVSSIVSTYGQTETGSDLNSSKAASVPEVQTGKRAK